MVVCLESVQSKIKQQVPTFSLEQEPEQAKNKNGAGAGQKWTGSATLDKRQEKGDEMPETREEHKSDRKHGKETRDMHL